MASIYMKDQAERMAKRARRSVEDGFAAVQVLVVPRTFPLDGAAALRHAERCMATIREAVGDQADIMVDPHGRTWPEMAIQYARVLAPYRPWFFKEPVPLENVEALAQVARAIPSPVAAGERLVTRYQFRELLERRACGIIQPDLLPLRRYLGGTQNRRYGRDVLRLHRTAQSIGAGRNRCSTAVRLRYAQLSDPGELPVGRALAGRGAGRAAVSRTGLCLPD